MNECNNGRLKYHFRNTIAKVSIVTAPFCDLSEEMNNSKNVALG